MGRTRGKKSKKFERSRILLDGQPGSGLSSIVSWLGRDDADNTTIGSFPLKMDDSGRYFLDDDMTKYRGFNVFHPHPGYGRCMYRPAIRFYYRQALAVVYVIDSNQPELISQNSEELLWEQMMSNEDLKDVPFIAIANKQDLPDAKSPAELEEMINKKLSRHIKVFPTTATTGEGVNECFDWLIDEITRRREEQAATEPFKDVASDVKEQGKTGMKMAKEAWKKLSGILGSSKHKG